jgi:hypothetical protein
MNTGARGCRLNVESCRFGKGKITDYRLKIRNPKLETRNKFETRNPKILKKKSKGGERNKDERAQGLRLRLRVGEETGRND